MTSALIVSTARTPLAKSWKGSFNMTHGATLGGHAVEHAIQRAGIEAALAQLTPASHARACDWAEAWAGVKGYGHIKQRNLLAVRAKLALIEASPILAAA